MLCFVLPDVVFNPNLEETLVHVVYCILADRQTGTLALRYTR